MKSRARIGGIIRDPIHGDVAVSALEQAVIDTRIFQRLRYIKQNGLLHFVFPGAVHTRFAHSVGTMHIAGRVARTLFDPLKQPGSHSESLDYLTQVFRLAALLHDVGHCAFSHSIEHVSYHGEPLLGTTRDLFTLWKESELLDEYEIANADADSEKVDLGSAVSHEEIGLILVRRIFEQDDRVGSACQALGYDPTSVGRDVRALMDGGLRTSDAFRHACADLQTALAKNEAGDLGDTVTEDIAEILHVLVSGTLDVDRLDYLVRDSIHCGVAYGSCQVDLLVGCLSLGGYGGQVKLMLSDKARHALDDMLWSRYQLFLQVLNHKTNVGLNSLLERAIPDAIDNQAEFRRPNNYDDFISFIDDYVIGTIFHFATHTRGDAHRFTKLLVDRRVPRHLGLVVLDGEESWESGAEREIPLLATRFKISPETIFCGRAKSELVKTGPPPLVVSTDRATGERTVSNFEEISLVLGDDKLSLNRYRVLHFYSERG